MMDSSHIIVNLDSIDPSYLGFNYEGTVTPVASHVRVDLTGFKLPKAKIDCITIDFPLKEEAPILIAKLESKLTAGRLEHPRNLHNVVNAGRMWLTLHDPSIYDLQRLIDFFPMARIIYIEFAVDFHLPDDCWYIDRVWTLARQFRHCLFPQMHPNFKKVRRKYCRLDDGRRYREDGLGTEYKGTTILYENTMQTEKLAMYVKTKDNGHDVNKPWVRVEARFKHSGVMRLGLEYVSDLVTFAEASRMRLSQAFWVAKDFEEGKTPRGRGFIPNPWAKFGAQFATRHPCSLVADTLVNQVVGKALCRLRESLMRLRHRAAPGAIQIALNAV